MKKKISSILGVALAIVLVLSLAVSLAPAAPASADPGELKWTKIPLPKIGEAGDYVLYPDSNVGAIAVAPDGETLFAAAPDPDTGDPALFKSTDGGETWKVMEDFWEEADNNSDTTPIVDIGVSPEYDDDTTLFVATEDMVYQSFDGGDAFTDAFDPTGPITDMDVALDEKGRLAVIVGTSAFLPGVTDTDDPAFTVDYIMDADFLYLTIDVPSGGYVAGNLTSINIDWDDDDAAQPQTDDMLLFNPGSVAGGPPRLHWGTGGTWDGGTTTLPTGMEADSAEGAMGEGVSYEFKLPLSVSGQYTVSPGDTIGISVYVNDGTNENKYPSGADGMVPSTWEDLILANGDVYVYCVAEGAIWEPQLIGTWDVLAVAFSPEFADDATISAVVTDASKTRVRFGCGFVDGVTDWDVTIGYVRIRDGLTGDPFPSTRACIGFPDDFELDTDSAICFVGLSDNQAIADPLDPIEVADMKGDVYLAPLKTVTFVDGEDLDVRGRTAGYKPTGTNITSIAVCGEADDASIIAGTDYATAGTYPTYWLTYRTNDSGESWTPSGTKSPTGGDISRVGDAAACTTGANTYVLMSPDFLTDGVAYASTSGDGTSAFSRSTDEGASYNQISLIDYADPSETGYTVVHMSPSPAYAKDETMFMATQVGKVEVENSDNVVYGPIGSTWGAIWKTTNDGACWERIWSYANLSVYLELNKVYLSSDDTVFAVDRNNKKLWRSSDGGATWPRKITAKEAIKSEKIVSPTTIYTGHVGGKFYYSTTSGARWTEPDDTELTAADIVFGISVKGDTILLSTDQGKVYISSDAGETFERVGLTNPGDTAGAAATPYGLTPFAGFDGGYATNGIIYAAVMADEDGGIWRTEVDEDNPDSADWERIDEESPGYGTVIPLATAILPGNIMYSADIADVEKPDVTGGMWRSVNPNEEDPDDVLFIKANKGLPTGASAALAGFSVFPTTMFCLNSTAVAAPDGELAVGNSMKLFTGFTVATKVSDYYYNQIVAFTDTLCAPVELVKPADGATAAGVILAEGNYMPTVTAVWKAMADADWYEYQLAVDEEFESKIGDLCDFTEGQIKKFKELTPGATYYWRVRVASENTTTHEPIGAPLISPWSEVWKFTTALGAGPARPDLVSPYGGPATGGVDTPLSPAFQWTQVFGATGFQLQLGTDSTFATTIADKKLGTETSWLYDAKLDFSTTYFWRVKAIGPSESPWSDVGSFVTEAKPPAPPPPPPAPPPPEPPPPTPAYIWTIIGIGAVLVIAVIVLIVRTRRVV